MSGGKCFVPLKMWKGGCWRGGRNHTWSLFQKSLIVIGNRFDLVHLWASAAPVVGLFFLFGVSAVVKVPAEQEALADVALLGRKKKLKKNIQACGSATRGSKSKLARVPVKSRNHYF